MHIEELLQGMCSESNQMIQRGRISEPERAWHPLPPMLRHLFLPLYSLATHRHALPRPHDMTGLEMMQLFRDIFSGSDDQSLHTKLLCKDSAGCRRISHTKLHGPQSTEHLHVYRLSSKRGDTIFGIRCGGTSLPANNHLG